MHIGTKSAVKVDDTFDNNQEVERVQSIPSHVNTCKHAKD